MTYVILIIALALIFDFINGFHDAANSIATVVSTKVLTPLQAVIWAAAFNFVAFFIFKDHGVANTVAKTVLEEYVTLNVIFSGLIAAIAWNLLTWWLGIPSSSSHTLIGGFAGAAVAHAGFHSLEINNILKVVEFIVLAPLIGMFMAFLISLWFIHSMRKSLWPKFLSLTIMAISTYVLCINLNLHPKDHHFENDFVNIFFYSKNFKWILIYVVLMVLSVFNLYISSLNFASTTLWFKRLQLMSSAIFSIGHGGNDAQKVMGIISVTLWVNAAQHQGFAVGFNEFHMPVWVPLACYSAISLGTLSGGWKIIKTMGTKITKVTPFEGVAAETAGAITLFLTESLKIPVSTTHTITGCIIGVGATKRLSAVRWGVTIKLLWAWLLTIPISGILAMAIYKVVIYLN